MSYSQNNEEALILAEFDRMGVTGGHFLDIGAWDGKSFSNTLALAERGWSGVCVEPSPFVFPKLVDTHRSRPSVTLVNAAIAPERSLVEWFDSQGDAVSTSSVSHRQKWETGTTLKFVPFFIQTLSVADLLARFGTAFDFINIDVEGTNLSLFNALPWPALSISRRVICIEHDYCHLHMLKTLVPLGWRQIGFNGENLLCAHD